jgi:hypothetical protein
MLFFLVPFVGTDWLGLQPDLYYLGYFTVAVVFFAAFAIVQREALRGLWTRRLWWSLAVGAVVGAAMVTVILRQPSTGHPDGWRFGFDIVWRGVVYGAVDAITLFVMPAAVAYLLLGGATRGGKRRAAFAGLALLLSMFVTVTYHLGYNEYRGDLMRYPVMGAVVANIPTAVTGNPVGAIVTHDIMHVGAVTYQHNGGQAHMLPPQVTADYPNHGSSDLAAGLAAGWLVMAGAAVTAVTRRRQPLHDNR